MIETQEVITKTNRKFVIEKDDTLYSIRLSQGKGYQITNIIRLRDLVPVARHIIDIGANIGNNTIEYATWADHVSSFEPTPHTRSWLEQNINYNKQYWSNHLGWYKEGLAWADMNPKARIDIYECALSNSQTNMNILTHPKNGGHNHLVSIANARTIQVQVKTLDSFNFSDVDAIKIDVEGYELPVLQGGQLTIDKYRPVIQTEIVEKQCQRAGYQVQELCDWFTKRDYIRTLKNGRIMPEKYEMIPKMMDSFWVPKERFKNDPRFSLFE